MATRKPKGGLTKWFGEKWVDIGRPKKKGKYQPCGRKKASTKRKGYPKCVPAAKAAKMAIEARSEINQQHSQQTSADTKPASTSPELTGNFLDFTV